MDWNSNYRSPTSVVPIQPQGLPPFPRCFSRLVDDDTYNNNGTSCQRESEKMLRERLENLCKENIISEFGAAREEAMNYENKIRDENSPFRKLNTALMRLRSEMECLRHLDLNLLCQLWSLSDAIQDYKLTVQDRHSESNSECSSNFCWTDSIDDFDSTDELGDGRSVGNGNSLNGSTSSLMQQINELKEKAESDFGLGK